VIYSLILNHGFESWQINPFGGPSAEVLIELGARYTPKILDGEWWRIITAQFIHAGIIHIILNLITQIPLCAIMESNFGTIRIAIVYIFSGIGGNLLVILVFNFKLNYFIFILCVVCCILAKNCFR